MVLGGDDLYAATPWVAGPAELVAHALELVNRPDGDTNRRVAMLALDNAVEIMIKVFMGLPERRGGLGINHAELRKLNFGPLLDRLLDSAPGYLEGLSIEAVSYYHEIRNNLYHQESGTTATRDNVDRYATVARVLFRSLFGVEAPKPRPDLMSSRAVRDRALGAETTDQVTRLLDKLQLLELTLEENAGQGAALERLETLRKRIASEVLAEESHEDVARLLMEVEDFLGNPSTVPAPAPGSSAARTTTAKLLDRLHGVENALVDLYDRLYPFTHALPFGTMVNEVASVLPPDLAEQLGQLSSWRNRIAHGEVRQIEPRLIDQAALAEQAIRSHLEVLRPVDIQRWREARGIN